MVGLLKSYCLILLVSSLIAMAQTPTTGPGEVPGRFTTSDRADIHSAPDTGWLAPGTDPQNNLGVPFLRHLGSDQKQFWKAPLRIEKSDLKTILPFVGTTGLLMAGDSWISKQVPGKPSFVQNSQRFSNYAAYSLIGAGGGAFVLGQLTHNDRLRETGLLSGEAAINSSAISYLLKEVTQRPRPFEKQAGPFFQGGNSFPSEHAAIAWSIASVVAHEYPGTVTKLLAYGLASGVTLSRVTGQRHFASDAFVGSVLGWYFGRQIYRAHHDPELGGAAWGEFIDSKPEGPRNPANMGSPYVPLDSWIYPAIERLAALGYIQTAYLGVRPWTRIECARLLEESGEQVRDGTEASREAENIQEQLAQEFHSDIEHLDGERNVGAVVDSVYTRFTGITGSPLRDGYHFNQTLTNDYGRPYGEGFNVSSGLTGYASAGPLSLFIRGEYQHSPAVSSAPLGVLEAIAAQDRTLPFANGSPVINRFRLLDSSIALTFHNFQFSFGKQSLWLGPGSSGPFLFSNNAEPIPMLRIDRVSPARIPLLSSILGPVRAEFFLGQLSGQQWVNVNHTLVGPYPSRQPFIHGTKISFKPTDNLEFGFGATVMFAGPGLPFTWHNLYRTFTSFNVPPGSAADPGDRRSTFDFSYRVPGIRDYLTIYADSFVEDEFSPIGSSRPSMRVGMYFPRLPKVPKLDLRLEGLYTDVPGQKPTGFVYWNGRYLSGYTNDGNLLASWIGRQGKGGQAWATYWFSPRNTLQIAYRHAEVDKVFIGGGRLNDLSMRGEYVLGTNLALSAFVQYEHWNFPVLSAVPQSDVITSVQLTFYPHFLNR